MRRRDRSTLIRLFLLFFGGPLSLDRFYEGDIGGGIWAILGFIGAFISLFGIPFWFYCWFRKILYLLHELEDRGGDQGEVPITQSWFDEPEDEYMDEFDTDLPDEASEPY